MIKNNMIKGVLLIMVLLFIIMSQSHTVTTLSKVKENIYKLEEIYEQKKSELMKKYTQLHDDLSEEIKTVEIKSIVLESKNTDLVEKNQGLIEDEQIKEKTIKKNEDNINTLEHKVKQSSDVIEDSKNKIKNNEIEIDELSNILTQKNEELDKSLDTINKINEDLKKVNSESKDLYDYSCEKLEYIENDMIDVDSLPILEIKY